MDLLAVLIVLLNGSSLIQIFMCFNFSDMSGNLIMFLASFFEKPDTANLCVNCNHA